MFYVYTVNGKFIKENELRYRLTAKIENASYWISKKSAKTWENSIKAKYPKAELREAVLMLK